MSAKRRLKIAGDKTKKATKERFNEDFIRLFEDAESVAKSVRQENSTKLKVTLLNSGLGEKSIASGMRSTSSKMSQAIASMKSKATSRARANSIMAAAKTLK